MKKEYLSHPVDFKTDRGYLVRVWMISSGFVEIFRPDKSLFWHGHYDKRYGEPTNRALDWCDYIDSDKFVDNREKHEET